MAVATIAACSGKSERHEGSSDDGAGGMTGGSGGTEPDGGVSGDASGGTSGSGAFGSGGTAGTYVPEQTDVPPEGDGRVSGSFEGSLGDGWDLCFSNKPGASFVRGDVEPTASAGSSYMRFDSALECTNPCRPDGEDAQFGFWLDAEMPASERVSLYFDAINLTDEAPSGVLQLDALGFLCETTEPLLTIELGDLYLTREWQTRCLTFASTAPFQVFGSYVLGESFHIGLDAFRFGPPCHAR